MKKKKIVIFVVILVILIITVFVINSLQKQQETTVVSQAIENEIFQFLTKTKWGDCVNRVFEGPFAPSCTALEFRKNGDYSWSTFSDYQERSQNGKWNFKLRNETSGVIYLDDGSIISFEKVGQNLNFLTYRSPDFLPAGEINYSALEAVLSRDSLPKIKPSEMYKKLIVNPWKKTNDFDLFMDPQLIIFYDNGRFFASYRDNTCTHEGYWSLDGIILTPLSDTNNCDLRGNTTASIAASNEKPTFEGDLLVFYSASYFNVEKDIGKKTFTFDAYTNSVRVTGEYSDSFIKNTPISIDFTFQNADNTDKELGRFEIKLQKLKPTDNGFTREGESLLLLGKDYSGIRLSPNQTHKDKITITPSISGNYINLEILLNFNDKRQSYYGRRGYILEIKE